VRAVATWEQCVRDADVIVEATRLTKPNPLLAGQTLLAKARVLGVGSRLPYRT
jgi:ornithine cyclodeaminase/alanine dehydrogenase-like protein (mu-crystallin family)